MVANHIWRIWANTLHRWGMENLAASILEAVGPLAVLGAQAVYLSQPILDGILPANHLQAMAHLFEDHDQRQAFIAILREASQG
jgi:hypothetical protein